MGNWKLLGIDSNTDLQVWECRKNSMHLIYSKPDDMRLYCEHCKVPGRKPLLGPDGRVAKTTDHLDIPTTPGMRSLICIECGEVFEAKRRNAKRCPPPKTCRQKAKRAQDKKG